MQDSTLFLEGELQKRGIVKEDKIRALKMESIGDTNDLDFSYPLSSWVPQSDSTGDWKMNPSLMD